jgi:hypothetical protein
MTVDFLEFTPKDINDAACVVKFNFEVCGILFKSWKIRCKDGIHYNISPPFLKYLGEKSDIIFFTDKEDFMQIARTVIQAARESGLLK